MEIIVMTVGKIDFPPSDYMRIRKTEIKDLNADFDRPDCSETKFRSSEGVLRQH